jgi:flagellar FliL protein
MAKKKGKGDDDAPKKGGKQKQIIAVVIAAALAYKFMLAPKPKAKEDLAAGATGAAAKIEEGGVVPLPDLTLNLAGSQTHYLRVGIALILEKGTTAESMKEELPIASDVAVDMLSEKTFEELNVPGSKTEIKKELSEKVREAYENAKVARVIFTSFVMQ